MDPLSIAGSIAGLVSVGDTVFRKLYHYIKDVNSAEKEVLALKNEIAELNGVLHNLHLIAEDLESNHTQDYSIRPGHVNACLATLYRLEADINKLDLGNKKTLRTKMQKLAWPFKAVDVKQFIIEIREHRSNLSFAMSADTMTALLKCLSKQDELLQGVNDVEAKLREKASIETRIALDEERQSILDSFLFVNPEESFRTSLRLRYSTTGFWLTENDTFTKWVRGSDNHLWLSGIPGAGKTVLSSLLIQRCLAQATQGRAVAFFYCDYKDKKSQNIVNILGTLASQLARQNEESFQLLKAYASTLRPQRQLPRNPEAQELLQLFKKMATTFEDVRVIVDGIDECGDGAADVSQTLKSLTFGHDVISICCLSRDEIDIREAFQPSFCDHIEIAAHTKDLEHYVRTEIEQRVKAKKLRVRSNDLKDEIIEQLVNRANGMFRWVSCQLDHLCALPTDARRRQALVELPSTLHETYERLLYRIDDQDIPLVRRTLQWIAYATPKLRVDQLVEIVSIDEYATELDSEACPDAEELLRLCGSLVRRSTQPYDSLELAHFTVQEFLEAIKPDDGQLSRFRLCKGDRITLAKTCVTYLCLPLFNRPSLTLFLDGFEGHTFFHHASPNLLEYLNGFEDDDDIHERLQELFDPQKSANLTNFMLQHLHVQRSGDAVELPDADEKWVNQICSHEFTTLHAAAMLHLRRMCAWLIEQGGDMNQGSTLGVPLECAIYGIRYVFSETDESWLETDHLYDEKVQDTIKIILDAGADCNPNILDEFCLTFAAIHGPTNTSSPFAMLLRHGMIIQEDLVSHFEDFYDEEDLLIELLRDVDQIENAKISAEAKIQLLTLARKVNFPTSQDVPLMNIMSDELFFDAVAYRVKFGPVKELESLTRDSRFSLDMRCQEGSGTLLHLAAKHNSPGPMKLLLNRGYDSSQLDDMGRTALHEAIESGMTDEDVLRRLVQSNIADVEDHGGETAWHNAATSGRHLVLSLLISHYGSESPCLWQTSEYGSTPLLEAIDNRHSDCASLLMKALGSAQSVAKDWRVLHYTVAKGLESLLEEILDHGVDPCVISDHNQNALYYVTKATTPNMLGLLISRGVDPDHLDIGGRSPLQVLLDPDRRSADFELLSVSYGDFMVFDSLVISKLVTPFSTNSTDGRGKTAWFYFCTKTVPSVFASQTLGFDDYLLPIFEALLREGALDSIKVSENDNGLGLLVEMCLEQLHKPSPTLNNKPEPVAKFLLGAICLINWTGSMTSSPQLVRLLIWSLLQPSPALFNKLLELQVDVHATSEFYQGDSTIDRAMKYDVSLDMFHSLLTCTPPDRIIKADAQYGLTHFVLCHSPRPEHSKQVIEKLEALLKLGVDPDVRSSMGHTAAMKAAETGFVEALRLLVRYGANLHSVDKYGWTVIQHAALAGQVAALRLIWQETQGPGDWKSTFVISVPRLMPDRTPAGPLSNVYPGCALSHLASCTRNSHTLQYLNDIGILGDVNAPTLEGVAPLHLAVCTETPETTRWLIDNGADVNMRCGVKQTTALHAALKLGRLENALILVEAGAEFVKDSDGVSPETQVHSSIRAEFLAFLDHTTASIPPSVYEVLKRDCRVQSNGGLFHAIVSGNLEACRSIIQSTSELPKSFVECGTCTPLIVAIFSKELDIAELLLRYGASTDGTPCPIIRNITHSDRTLEMAIMLPQFNGLLEQILEKCLEYEAHWSQDGAIWRPLQITAAINLGGLEILIKHLRTHSSLFRHDTKTRYDNQDEGTFIRSCLELKSPVNCPNPSERLPPGSTTIHVAAHNKNPEIVEYLLSLGVGVDTRDNEGCTPLHCASRVGCTESVSKLLRHGAAPISTSSTGVTPFMLAAYSGTVEVMSILVRFETNVASADYQGRSALHLAALGGKVDSFKYLISTGWDPYKPDKEGCSPIYYALSHTRLSSYIYASCLDLTHLVPESGVHQSLSLSHGNYGSRFFYRWFPKDSRLRYVNTLFDGGFTPLISSALQADVEGMRIRIKAGAELEIRNRDGETALIAACRAGCLSSVAFLVRQGSRLEYTYEDRRITAYQKMRGRPDIIEWLLVKRWTDQCRITGSAFNSDERIRPWTGIRTVEIPLRGRFARPKGASLFDHAKHLHTIAKSGWRVMVPLGWDTIEHLIPLPGTES